MNCLRVHAFAFVALALQCAPARAQYQVWLRQIGSFSTDYPAAIATTESGGVLVTGQTLGHWFPGTVDPPDVFLARFDDAGNFLWGVQFGTSGDDIAFAVAADGAGGSFIAGRTAGSLGGPYAGGNDAWFARRGSAGNALWARQLGTPQWDEATGLVLDGEGGVFVTGGTDGALAQPAPGPSDGWIARYDGGGSQVWLRQVGTPVDDTLNYAAPDAAGGIYGAGNTVGAFGGPPMGEADVWVARFTATGDQLWARQVGTALNESARALCDDGVGGLFVAGFTNGNLGAPNAGAPDAWIARYDASGNQLSLLQLGSAGADLVEGIAPDGFGGAFAGGSTGGSLFGPNVGLTDIWVLRTFSASSILWSRQFGTPYFDAASALAPRGRGSAFVAGPTGGNLIGGGGGTGSWDVWLARYDVCYADCNADGALTVADFGCFQTRFITADVYTDCNADGVLTVQDFGCFQTRFVVGCP